MVTLHFNLPVYDWIIQTIRRKKVPNTKVIVETSHSDLFNYDNDLKEIAEIEELIKQHEYLFNKST